MFSHFRLVLSGALFLSFIDLGNAEPQSHDVQAGGGEKVAATPEAAVRQFLAAMAEQDSEAIERAILPHPLAEHLFRTKGPQRDVKQVGELPLKRLKPGDRVAIPGGKSLVLDETHVNEERAQLMAPNAPLPFIVVKLQDEWLVNAAPVIEARRRVARPARRAAWTADAAAHAAVADEATVGEYLLHPPAEFKLTQSGPGVWAWLGKSHGRNVTPAFLVTTTELAETDVPKSLEDGLRDALTGIENRFLEWQVSDAERGEIAGLPFVRAYWAGVRRLDAPESVRGQRTHGFVYLAVNGNGVIQLLFQDAEPKYRANLKICEAAVFTWRKP